MMIHYRLLFINSLLYQHVNKPHVLIALTEKKVKTLFEPNENENMENH